MQINIKRKSLRRQFSECWQLYVLLIVPLAYIVIFHYVPMIGAQIAFRKYSYIKGIWNSQWVGFKNFETFFNSYQFSRVITNTLVLSVYGLIAGFPLPILFALTLNAMRGKRLKRSVQLISYAPHFISTTVLVGMLMSILQYRTGVYGILGKALSGSFPPDLFSDAAKFPHLYVWSGIWQNMGWNAIIYIAALSGVDVALHEAAMIDGASRFQRIRFIELPSILPTASVLLILNTGNILSVGFEKVYLMQNSLNLQTSEIISTYVYKVGLTSGANFSLSTAIGLFNSVCNMTILLLVNYTSDKLSGNSLF